MKYVCRTARAVFITTLLGAMAACGGGGGDSSDDPSGPTTTVSGQVTFDRVPVTDDGLNFNGTTQEPARDVIVEAIQSDNSAILASTSTGTSGTYSLTVPSNTSMFIRAKAQMAQTGSGATWNFRVLNNTNGNALYALDSSTFNSGGSARTQNLRAASGWGGSAYTGTRAAASFAILDTVYRARELLRSAQADLTLPALDLYWSGTNRSSDNFCPSQGSIGTTSFVSAASGDTDDCSQPLSSGIYVLGEISDTDEFDQHVVAHEFGHYAEAEFSRSDSIGGPHGSFDEALDPRVAFGEGWGNAYSGMVLDNPDYRDSFGTEDVTGFDLDNNAVGLEGWYSEASVGQILWDVFDGGTEPGDTVNLPFSSIFVAFTGTQSTTDALTSIFSFAEALRDVAPAAAADINALLDSEDVNGTDEFGLGETNFASEPTLQGSVYATATAGATTQVCTTSRFGIYNKLNNRRFLTLDLRQVPGTYSITATGAASPAVVGSTASPDPEIILWRRGQFIDFAAGTGGTELLGPRTLAAAVYIVEVFDAQFGAVDGATGIQPRCMNVTVQ